MKGVKKAASEAARSHDPLKPINFMKDVYTKLKFFRFREQLDALENGHIASPVHVRIKPINVCDHHCWYCAYHDPNLQLGEAMEYKDRIPRDKLMEIIDDLAEMKVGAVTFSGGGEPLIYPHITEAVHRIGKHNLKLAALTNASHLNGEVAEAFARYGTWIRVSIDGWDGPSYAGYRGVKDDEFQRVTHNMKSFVKLKSQCVLGINYIIDNKNYSHIEEFVGLMKDIGVNHVKVMGVIVSNDGQESNQYHEGIRRVVREQLERVRVLESANFKIIDHYHEFPERFNKGYTTCPSMQFLTIIGADSKVYSCHDKAYTKRGFLGSVVDRSFKEFWFSDENQEKMRSIDPSVDCNHHCAEHRRNLLLQEYLSADTRHIEFV